MGMDEDADFLRDGAQLLHLPHTLKSRYRKSI